MKSTIVILYVRVAAVLLVCIQSPGCSKRNKSSNNESTGPQSPNAEATDKSQTAENAAQPRPDEATLRDFINTYLGRSVRHTLHAYKVLNTFPKQIDQENRIVFDFVAFGVQEGQNPVTEDGALKLHGFRGSISCVKRGNLWYARPFSQLETVDDAYNPTDEEMRILAPVRAELPGLAAQVRELRDKANEIFMARSSNKPGADVKDERAANDKANEISKRIEQVRIETYHRLFDKDFSPPDETAERNERDRIAQKADARQREEERNRADKAKKQRTQANDDRLKYYENVRKGPLSVRALLDDQTGEIVEQFVIGGDVDLDGWGSIIADVENQDKVLSACRTFLDWCSKSKNSNLAKFQRVITEFDDHSQMGREARGTKMRLAIEFDPEWKEPCHLLSTTGARFSPAVVENAIESMQNDLPPLLRQARRAPDAAQQMETKIDRVLSEDIATVPGETNSAAPNDPNESGNSAAQDSTRQLMGFLKEWLDAKNAGDLSKQAELHSDPTEYYDRGVISHDQLLADFQKDQQRWPVQSHSIDRVRRIDQLGEAEWLIVFERSFDARNPSTGRSSAGTATVKLTVRRGATGNPEVVSTKEKVTSRSRQ